MEVAITNARAAQEAQRELVRNEDGAESIIDDGADAVLPVPSTSTFPLRRQAKDTSVLVSTITFLIKTRGVSWCDAIFFCRA